MGLRLSSVSGSMTLIEASSMTYRLAFVWEFPFYLGIILHDEMAWDITGSRAKCRIPFALSTYTMAESCKMRAESVFFWMQIPAVE